MTSACSRCAAIHSTSDEVIECLRSQPIERRQPPFPPDMAKSVIMKRWQRRWGNPGPHGYRQFRRSREVEELVTLPGRIVLLAIDKHKELIDILRYVLENYDQPGDDDGFDSAPGDNPSGRGPDGGGSRVPRRTVHPSGSLVVERDLPSDDYRFDNPPRRFLDPRKNKHPSNHRSVADLKPRWIEAQ